MKLPDHLGGHCGLTHIDIAVLKYMVTKHQIQSFLDIGCGPGGMVLAALGEGLRAMGIDGDFSLPKRDWLVLHDFTCGPVDLGEFDLAWSVEFLEHVDEIHVPNFMESFLSCSWVVCTHAPPGKRGHHHVNTRDNEYWLRKFSAFGFEHAEEETKNVRAISSMKREFMRETGLVFRRADSRK